MAKKTTTKSVSKRKKSPSKKMKAHQKKFTKAVQSCHRTTNGRKSFGKCLSKKLTKKK